MRIVPDYTSKGKNIFENKKIFENFLTLSCQPTKVNPGVGLQRNRHGEAEDDDR
jgi:hypothetical protein